MHLWAVRARTQISDNGSDAGIRRQRASVLELVFLTIVSCAAAAAAATADMELIISPNTVRAEKRAASIHSLSLFASGHLDSTRDFSKEKKIHLFSESFLSRLQYVRV